MREEVRQPLATQDREAWAKPELKRLDAGSAELLVDGASDGPNQVS